MCDWTAFLDEPLDIDGEAGVEDGGPSASQPTTEHDTQQLTQVEDHQQQISALALLQTLDHSVTGLKKAQHRATLFTVFLILRF